MQALSLVWRAVQLGRHPLILYVFISRMIKKNSFQVIVYNI
jgi:hypothetical protein